MLGLDGPNRLRQIGHVLGHISPLRALLQACVCPTALDNQAFETPCRYRFLP